MNVVSKWYNLLVMITIVLFTLGSVIFGIYLFFIMDLYLLCIDMIIFGLAFGIFIAIKLWEKMVVGESLL